MIYRIVSALRDRGQVSHDDIRTRHQRWRSRAERASQRRIDRRFSLAVDQGLNFDRFHARADGNLSDDRASVCRVTEHIRKLIRD
ncbi:MAG: hypothetical protein DME89_13570 [Verrucomicrobia bacterium]|nr:MAG: hypothetical protein DMC60_05305 [Verrucomicrobiota bacterium]PYJ14573.1 MAG: hypothetical protein DME94_08910 [Verrucomicrobiota bacterium]PYJ24501.1 MAG: hypothetical protein DME89_13570 [Verrucomicrobiota bacterium]PYL53621.1 MAG: hypothetical protein DMF33_04095 [Verrucomicrobiota bacterium]